MRSGFLKIGNLAESDKAAASHATDFDLPISGAAIAFSRLPCRVLARSMAASPPETTPMPPTFEAPPSSILPWIVRGQALAQRSYRDAAVDWMVQHRAPAAAIRIVKAGVPAGSTLDPDYNSAAAAFLDSAKTASAFLRLLSDRALRIVPLRQRVMITVSPGVAAQVGEGIAKPVSAVRTRTVVLDPVVKAVAQTAFTNELIFDLSAAGMRQFHSDLVAAVSKSIDTIFLDLITDSGTASAASAGPTAGNAWTDLRNALAVVNTTGAGKLYWIMGPGTANRAATLDANGLRVFPEMSPGGGELTSLPALVSDGVPASELYLVDANRILANADTVVPRTTTQADMLLADNPAMDAVTPTPAQMTSLWQTNSTGVQVDTYFAAQVLHHDPNEADDVVAVVTNVAWGG